MLKHIDGTYMSTIKTQNLQLHYDDDDHLRHDYALPSLIFAVQGIVCHLKTKE